MNKFEKWEKLLLEKNYKKEDSSNEDTLVFTNEEVRTCVFLVENLNKISIDNCIKIQTHWLNYPFADKWAVVFFINNEMDDSIIDDPSYFLKRPIDDIDFLSSNKKKLNIKVEKMFSYEDKWDYTIDAFKELNWIEAWNLYKYIWNLEKDATIKVPAISDETYNFIRYVVWKNIVS